MNKIKSGFAVLGFSALALAGPAAADNEQGLYIGASGGMVQYKDSCGNVPVPCDDVDTAFRGFGGWRFNRNFALEFGYADLGSAEGSGLGLTYEKHVYSFDLSGVFTFQLLGNLHGLARLGAYRAKAEVETSAGGVTTRSGSTNTAWLGGLGLEYQLSRLGLRVEWLHWLNVKDPVAGNTDDLDALMLGVTFRF